jgi:hypothetical protein
MMVEAHAATHVETGASAGPVVDAAPPENSSAAVSGPLVEKVADKDVPQPTVTPRNLPATQPAEEADASKSPGRGKKMLQSVGHWLHIGKKDVPAEAVRQP